MHQPADFTVKQTCSITYVRAFMISKTLPECASTSVKKEGRGTVGKGRDREGEGTKKIM
jgi:hypothetical protein